MERHLKSAVITLAAGTLLLLGAGCTSGEADKAAKQQAANSVSAESEDINIPALFYEADSSAITLDDRISKYKEAMSLAMGFDNEAYLLEQLRANLNLGDIYASKEPNSTEEHLANLVRSNWHYERATSIYQLISLGTNPYKDKFEAVDAKVKSVIAEIHDMKAFVNSMLDIGDKYVDDRKFYEAAGFYCAAAVLARKHTEDADLRLSAQEKLALAASKVEGMVFGYKSKIFADNVYTAAIKLASQQRDLAAASGDTEKADRYAGMVAAFTVRMSEEGRFVLRDSIISEYILSVTERRK